MYCKILCDSNTKMTIDTPHPPLNKGEAANDEEHISLTFISFYYITESNNLYDKIHFGTGILSIEKKIQLFI